MPRKQQKKKLNPLRVTALSHCKNTGDLFRGIDIVNFADLAANAGGFLRASKTARLFLETLANIPFNFPTIKTS
jgi:hypothetical protein